jgi:fused signal recognition particle receptor
MSKLFGWFGKNKKANKQKAQENQDQKSVDQSAVLPDESQTSDAEQSSSTVESVVNDTANSDLSETAQSEVSEAKSDLSEAQSELSEAQSELSEAQSELSETESVSTGLSESDSVESTAPVADKPVTVPVEKEDTTPVSVVPETVDAVESADEATLSASVTHNEDAEESIPEPVQELASKQENEAPVVESSTQTASVSEAEAEAEAEVTEVVSEPVIEEAPAPKEKKSLFSRLKESLSRTKANLGSGLVSLFKGKAIDDELYEDLETQLLVADVGMDTTQKIITHLTDSASRKDLKDAEALLDILKQQMAGMLSKVNEPLSDAINAHNSDEGPFVILMVGVNGVGKTTTIGKLAKQFQQQGKKVMLAAGDTFRAAAVEQLQVWGERNSIPVIAQHTGADSASVLYDALEAAKSRKTDILIADTAGRLQNKDNLMEELKKVVRVMKKLNPNAPHEVMLTLDAGTGQNAISQAKLFNQAVGLTGITLTKLDGTAKGGVIFSIADKFGIPIRYIGVGEGIDDLRQFDGQEFIDALFSEIDSGE